MVEQIHHFKLNGTPVSCNPYGTGHINSTFLIETDKGSKYILQWINRNVFKQPEVVMRNIAAITDYLRARFENPESLKQQSSLQRSCLHLVSTLDDKLFYIDDNNETWRVYDFIDSLTIELPERTDDFYEAGVAFGEFQKSLSGFNAELLSDTIPRFHDTPNRFAQLKEAIKNDAKGRLKDIKSDIDFVMSYEEYASKLVRLLAEGALPLRVTHNDTKLNNVLFDKDTRKPICIVDLDTVMPGLIAYDFGDAIRTGASTAAEDEVDLSKVGISLEMFEAFTHGFVKSSDLTETELETLRDGAKMMTLENAVRFLTDYLNGDVYFKISRPEHNLERARTQFRLIKDMEAKWEAMQEIVMKA